MSSYIKTLKQYFIVSMSTSSFNEFSFEVPNEKISFKIEVKFETRFIFEFVILIFLNINLNI
jgi:hypothetical protein